MPESVQDTLVETSADDSDHEEHPVDELSELSRGALVSRYVVLGKLGAGGMGVVYAAHDPELDRKVALKLLRPGALGFAASTSATDASARLLREAQALAKLSHPHVVAIHDVGEHQGGVWLAMEFVDGVTLKEWLDAQPRSWREVLSVMVPAARGLAAAHDAGLVHRDFKPDNVMVGADGRTRVMDLGLARGIAREQDRAPKGAAGTGPSRADEPQGDRITGVTGRSRGGLDAALTQPGSMMGTPAYMSPEQYLGLATSPASDQFSFCVTLWEALYGERPFGGESLTAMALNVTEGKLRPPPRGAKVPAWLRRVCLRGLSVDPNDRFPSVSALLDAFDRARRRVRVGTWAAGVLVVAALGAGTEAYRRIDRARQVAACEARGDRIHTEVWTDDAHQAVRNGLEQTKVSYAKTTADKVMPWLDARADDWREHRTRVCVEAEVEGTMDAERHDRALWCLEDRRIELAALIDALAGADETVALRALSAAAGLNPAAPCVDPAVLDALPSPPPAEKREGATRVRKAVSRAQALAAAGKYPEGLEVAQVALADAEELGWTPLTAKARRVLGALLDYTGAHEGAEEASYAAYLEAAKVRAWDEAAEAAVALSRTVGEKLARHAEGEVWADHAEVALSLAGDPLGLVEARRLNQLGVVRYRKGDFEGARILHDRAVAILEQSLGPEHPSLASPLLNLGNTYAAAGEFEQTRVLFERALAISEKAQGAGHPFVAAILGNLGNVHYAKGELDQARALYQRSLEIKRAVLPPNHPDIGNAINNLGNVHHAKGEYEDARALYEQALSIREEAYGPDHPEIASALINIGAALKGLGDVEAAAAMYERALAIQDKSLGPEHPAVVRTLTNLGNARAKTGDPEAARALYERALAVQETSLGADHPDVAETLGHLGRLELAQGRAAEAVVLLERAIAIYDASEAAPRTERIDRFALAKALIESGGDEAARARAIDQAKNAARGWREAGVDDAGQLAEIDAFLAAHDASP